MKKIKVNLKPSYNIIVDANLIDNSAKIVKDACKNAEKAVIVTDDVVDALYSERLVASLKVTFDVYKYVIPHGENSKSFGALGKILLFLADCSLSRNDIVIALGGGVVGDIAGLASSLYMRGIRIVQVPTTLLAMVDSSVGGKTAVDLGQGKNLVGTFHQPSLVLCDTETLKTLPTETFNEGVAEIIKYGLISNDINIKRMLGNSAFDNVSDLIVRSISIKAHTVEKDEKDNSYRQILNFGHTVGHAIEKCSHYKISHGRAVAMGMYIEAKGLSLVGYSDFSSYFDIKHTLEKYNLFYDVPFTANELFSAAMLDKKHSNGNVTLPVLYQDDSADLITITENDLYNVISAGLENVSHEIEFIPSGTVTAPRSKSEAHRYLIASALSKSTVSFVLPSLSDDVKATIEALNASISDISYENGVVTISPKQQSPETIAINCGDSGSTFRFMLPILATFGAESTVTVSKSLSKRPITELIDALNKKGADIVKIDECTYKVKGKLQSGKFYLPGNISSQFVSGLLFALPLISGKSVIELTSKLESEQYVALTESILTKFQITTQKNVDGYAVNGNQAYVAPHEIKLCSDWSTAAFLLSLGALNGEITLSDIDFETKQKDKVIIDILRQFGADVSISNVGITVKKPENQLKAITFDASDNPDLVPVVAALGAVAKGKTVIKGVSRLKFKETNRLDTVVDTITKLGGDAHVTKDGFIAINGKNELAGGNCFSYNDHRIVMEAVLLSCRSKEKVKIYGMNAINKSYPDFIRDMQKIGGKINVIDDRN